MITLHIPLGANVLAHIHATTVSHICAPGYLDLLSISKTTMFGCWERYVIKGRVFVPRHQIRNTRPNRQYSKKGKVVEKIE